MELVSARLLAAALETYAVVGLLFAVVFLPREVLRVDPRLEHSPVVVRLLILPGVAAFWPLFARRWVRGLGVPDERNPHRDRARSEHPAEATR
jgi:hypothetical protein